MQYTRVRDIFQKSGISLVNLIIPFTERGCFENDERDFHIGRVHIIPWVLLPQRTIS